MSSQLFSRSYDAGFEPLFRMLSDFDNYSRGSQALEQASGAPKHRPTRLVSPKFDMHETKETYELHGELPGFDRENVHIEFADAQSLIVSGQIERSYTSGTPPSNLIQGTAEKPEGTIEAPEEHHNSHKATVEDEESAAAKEKEQEPHNGHVVKHKGQKQKPVEHTEKFWVSERSFGKFQRQFSFPSPVNQDEVKASLKDGILNVSIPKAKPKNGRRIAIN